MIYRGKVSEIGNDGTIPRSVVWKLSDAVSAGEYTADLEKKFDEQASGMVYADINSSTADVEWELKYEGDENDISTEVYYCPDGDDGEAIFINSSNEAEHVRKGKIGFDTADYGWSRNAYVWIKATNGVNSIDLYSDEIEITLCYSDIKLSGAGIKSTKDNKGKTAYWAEYTGNAIEPSTTVKAYDPDTGKYVNLKRDTDYSVTYENNTSVGLATVTVQGIGLYGGKNSAEFEIIPKQLVGTPGNIPDIKWSKDIDTEVVKYISMMDKTNKPLNLYDNDTSEGDFKVSYTIGDVSKDSLITLLPADLEEGEKIAVTVTYSGVGNYTGDCKTKTVFNVLPSKAEIKDLSKATVTLKKDTMSYTGKVQKPAVKEVVLEDGTKVKSSDYTVVYSDNIAVGKGRVTVIGKKNYTESASKDFTIAPKEVTSLSVSGLKNQSYTGEKVEVDKLPIIVKAGGITLVKDRDYTIEDDVKCDYTNVTTKDMKSKGTAPKVVIKLKTKSSKTRSADCPVVVWGNNVREDKKTVTKTFSIVSTKLNSAVVSFTLKGSKTEENIVMSKDGTKQIGTIRNATKAEIKEGNNKFTYIIEGTAAELEQDADLSQTAFLMVNGNKLVKGTDYEDVVKVSKTKNGKIGTITYKAKAGSPYTGTRVIKFKYQQNLLQN